MNIKHTKINRKRFYRICRDMHRDWFLDADDINSRLNISNDKIYDIITNPIYHFYGDSATWKYSFEMVYLCLSRKDELPDKIIKGIFDILHFEYEDVFYKFIRLCEHIRDNGHVNIKNVDKLAKLCLEEYENMHPTDGDDYDRIILNQVIYTITRLIKNNTISEFGYIFNMLCMNEKICAQSTYAAMTCTYVDNYLAKDVINEDLIRSMMDSDKDYINLASINLAGYMEEVDLLDEALKRFIEKYPNFFNIRDYTNSIWICSLCTMAGKHIFDVDRADIIDGWRKSENKYLAFIGKDTYEIYEGWYNLECG